MLFGESKTEAYAKSKTLLNMVGLDDVPQKKRAGQYSGGMKRRLDLALALAHDPSVLFLDEPTTGLDPISRAAIWSEVRRLNKEHGMTIFLTTQYLEEADRLADRIAIINEGSIVAGGTPGELKRALGEEVVQLDFAEDDETSRAETILKGITERIQREGTELSCFLPDATSAVPRIITELNAKGIIPAGLNVSQPTLDDVFLEATGMRFSNAAVDNEASASETGSNDADVSGPLARERARTPVAAGE